MLIDDFFKRGKDFLGCEIPIMCGAMTWISDPKLVSAVANAGGFGLLAGGNSPVEIFENEILATRQMTENPFGVNLITVAPVYHDQLRMVCEQKCDVVVFAGSIPKSFEIEMAKNSGAKVICFASTGTLAMSLIDRGADASFLKDPKPGGISVRYR
ncbi:MAG: nitronate monooxygenase [Desulfobacterales bacterium]|nr:nitronate monooxygenase [Desulfobacterales bacterium]